MYPLTPKQYASIHLTDEQYDKIEKQMPLGTKKIFYQVLDYADKGKWKEAILRETSSENDNWYIGPEALPDRATRLAVYSAQPPLTVQEFRKLILRFAYFRAFDRWIVPDEILDSIKNAK